MNIKTVPTSAPIAPIKHATGASAIAKPAAVLIPTAIALPVLTPIAYAVAVAMLTLSGANVEAQVAAVLPTGPRVVQGAKLPSVTERTMTIEQVAPRAIINWDSFNIGAGDTVRFNQQGRSDWAVLNRVIGTERSVIRGVLQADGEVFLLNNNGILIGRGAQVNVHSFLASTLTLSDKVFNDGILTAAANRQPLLTAGTGAFSPRGNIQIEPGAIVVSKEGGRLAFFASGQVYDADGKLMLDSEGKPLGLVENNGRLVASNGQIIVAAGDKIYLRLPSGTLENKPENGFSGLVVEVDSGGKVVNAVLGFIQSKLGNISMVGLTVNQDGRVSATTSVNRNGSIWLMAKDTAVLESGPGGALQSSRGGQLSLGASSLTDILPDQDNVLKTTVDASPFSSSKVRLEGQTIHFQGTASQGARLIAPNADVSVRARIDPRNNVTSLDQAAVVFDQNSRIDVSGLKGSVDGDGNLTSNGVIVPVERNSIKIELLGEQLADAPLLKDSPISRQAIYVDARVGTPLINQATVAEAIKSQVQRGIFERMTKGGTVDISSTGSVALLPGSSIALTGGTIAYSAGRVRTSRLFDGAVNYDIATAPNDRRYLKISEVLKLPEKASVAGQSAGSLKITSRNLLLEGEVKGGALVGTNQQATAPFRGSLSLDSFTPSDTTDLGLRHGLQLGQISTNQLGSSLVTDVTGWSVLLDQQFGQGLLGKTQTVSAKLLANSELSFVSLATNGSIEILAGDALNLKAGTDLTLNSKQTVTVDRSIRSAGGQLRIGGDAGVTVADNVSLDVSGLWLNDVAGKVKPTRVEIDKDAKERSLINGGEVQFATSSGRSAVVFGANTKVDTSAGAFINANQKITGGEGGKFSALAAAGSSSQTFLPTQLVGYGFKKGSEFSFGAPAFWFGPNAPSLSQLLDLDKRLDQGFSKIELTADQNVTFASGFQFGKRLTQYELPTGRLTEQGDDLRNRARTVELVPAVASKVELAFTGLVVEVQPGANINLPVGGQLKLTASNVVSVAGNLTAPSGDITLATNNSGRLVGFLPDAGIKIAAGASIDVSGAAVQNLQVGLANTGEVRPGGTVNLIAGSDSGTIQFDENAKIAIGGTSATFDVAYKEGSTTRYRPAVIASDAGSLNVTSVQGGVFAGTVLADGGSVDNASGKLTFKYATPGVTNVVADVPVNVNNPLLFPLSENQFVLTNAALTKPLGYSFLGDWDVLVNGPRPVSNVNLASSVSAFAKRISQWRISSTSLQGAGSLDFEGAQVTRFDGITGITARESIRVASVVFRTDADQKVSFTAPYIRLGSQNPGETLLPSGVNTGQVTFNAAKGLDLESNFAVQGASLVTVNSAGSVRLVGGAINAEGYAQGSLTVPGNLTVVAANVFPVSRTTYKVNAIDGDVSFSRPSNATAVSSSDVPFSALGIFSVTAANIDQAGAVYAPFGEIALTATQNIRFSENSITSVSGAGLQIPLGAISNGVAWVVGTTPLQNPNKTISINAPTVVVEGSAAGKPARIDASGGGDILAYEFVKGPQGSADLYAAPSSFAVLPTYAAAFSPLLVGDISSTNIARGATIRIESGVAGLPAGVYKVLPAAYAQLEGAFLIRPVSSTSLGTPVAQSDVRVSRSGISSVIGYRAREEFGVTSQKPEWFEALSSAQVRTLGEFRSTSASRFFGDEAASRVQDAGTVSIGVNKALDLSGTINLAADTLAPLASVSSSASATGQARRGTIEISSDGNLRIAADAVPVGNQGGAIVVSQAKLGEINAGDVHIGGRVSKEGSKLITQANSVTVDSGVVVKAGTVILTANNGVTLNSDSKIEASGPSARKPSTEPRQLNSTKQSQPTDSSGSTIIASSQTTTLTRSGSIATSGPQLKIDSQAVVSGASVTVDTTGLLSSDASAQFLGTTDTKIGTQIFLIGDVPVNSLGNPLGGTPGFVLTGNLLNALNQTASISLQGYQKVVAYGAQTLGSGRTNRLRLDTPTLAAGAANASLNLTAGRIDWLRSSAGTTAALGAVIGGTQITFNTTGNTATDGLRIGTGDKSIDGFANVTFNVGSGTEGSRLNFEGKSTLDIAGNLTAKVDQIQTSLVSGSAPLLADANVNVAGNATFSRNTTQSPSEGSEGAGGKVGIKASSLSFDTVARMPSGELALASTNGDLTLGSQSAINVAGYERQIFDQRIELAGGTIRLTAEKAGTNLTIADGAKIDVSAGNNTAGTLEIRSAGALTVGQPNTLKGGSALANRGGALLIDAQMGVNLDQVAKISVDGQFNRSLDVRARTGDLSMSQNSRINTETVVIAADSGGVTMAGTIDASSSTGGKVELWQKGSGTQVLTLADTAKINVSGGTGGEVTLGSTNAIVVTGRPLISGGSADNRRAGTLTLRAPRTGPGPSGNGIAIAKTAAGDAIRVAGRVETSIEGVRGDLSFASTLGSAAGINIITADAAAFQANAQSIINSVPLQTTGPVQVLAGIDILATAGTNTTNTAGLDFGSASVVNSGLGTLTVRSTGDLTIAGSISDGITGTTTLSRNSWSYRLTAGADSAAANPFAVKKNLNPNNNLPVIGTGTLTIAGNKDVRTGTGSIGLAASDQILFQPGPGTGATSSAQPGSVYTFGRLAGAIDGYVVEPGYFSGVNVPRTQGGAVTVKAGGKVVGNDMLTTPASWFLRQGALNATTELYSAVPGYLPTLGALGSAVGFNMHLGSLAGGKLTVNAQGTENLYLANVSTGRMRSTTPDLSKFEVINRAPTTVTVTGDIVGGQFMTMDGELNLSAGQSIKANTNKTVPILFQGNTAITANARGDLAVSRPFNPSLLTLVGGTPTFSTFGNDASLNLSSVNTLSVQEPSGTGNLIVTPALTAALARTYARITTPNWKIQSATNIRVGLDTVTRLAPTDNRNFSLLAGNNIWSQQEGRNAIETSNVDPNLFSVLKPFTSTTLPSIPELFSARRPPDIGDEVRAPIRIYAGSGDVAPSPETVELLPPTNRTINFSFGQPIAVKAGRDVSQLVLIAQNNTDADETSIQAGRDIANQFQTVNGAIAPNDARIEVRGPGTAVLMAGRDIRFGNKSNRDQGSGFSSTGNAQVADLAKVGAAMVLIAGIQEQPAYDALLETYLKPDANGLSFDQSRHVSLARESLIRAGQAADAKASPSSIWNSVQALARSQRDQLARDIFFQELRIAGGPDTTSIVRDFIAPVAGGNRSVRFTNELVIFLASRNDATANADNAWAKFQALPKVRQAEFVSSIALPKLLSDKALLANDARVRSYGRGYAASALLFKQDGVGNIDLVYNAVRSEQGGPIQLLAPGTICRDQSPADCATTDSTYKASPAFGNVDVGVANPPATVAADSSLGIASLGGGNLQSFAGNNINVNQSRIVAAGGGDLLLWSSGGNIDAGRGSKTAISVPPPVISVNKDGVVTVDFSNAIQGSGIRAVEFEEKNPSGSVSLYAPKGFIDAGDAGIVGGNVNVGALVILNADNIRTTATQNEVPSSSLAPAALAPPAGSASATDVAKKAIAITTPGDSKRVRIILIDFEGFGPDCKENPSDPTCKQSISSSDTTILARPQ